MASLNCCPVFVVPWNKGAFCPTSRLTKIGVAASDAMTMLEIGKHRIAIDNDKTSTNCLDFNGVIILYQWEKPIAVMECYIERLWSVHNVC